MYIFKMYVCIHVLKKVGNLYVNEKNLKFKYESIIR